MATPAYNYFDPNRGYVPAGSGVAPNAAYNASYDPQTGQFGSPPVGNNPYPYLKYQYSGPGFNAYGQPNDNMYGGYPPYYGPAIDKMAQNDRDMALAGGLSLGSDIRNWTNYQYGRAGNYEDQATSAWDPIARGQGGYSDAQKEAILNNPYLQNLQMSPGQQQSNYLTGDEQFGITGNPYAAMDYLNGQDLQGQNNMWANQIGQGIEDQGTAIGGTLQGTQTQMRNAASQMRGDQFGNLSDIAALTRGTVGQGYGDVRGAVGQGYGNVRGALDYSEAGPRSYLDPTTLRASADYMRDYNVSDRDMQNIRDKAGSVVGNTARMDEENLNQAANAQGNTSPLALAAARDRIRLTGGVNAATAMTAADIAARQLKLATTQGRENTRLGAEQQYAGLGSGTELALGNRRVGSELNLAGQNLAAEQNLMGHNLQNEQYMGSNTLGTTQQVGQAQLGAEQYLGSQALQGQTYLGGSRLSNLQENAQRGAQTGQFQAGLGTSTMQGAEAAASGRAGTLATNRQGVNQYNQGNEFQRGQYIYDRGAQANTGFANAQRTDEQGYRDYLTGQQTQANQGAQVGNQQRIGVYGATNTGAQGGTEGSIKNYAIPGAWQAIAGTVNSFLPHAKGGEIRGPQLGLVGEAGPELIIDLDKMPHYGLGGFGGTDEDEEYGSMYGTPEEDAPELGGVMTGPRASRSRIGQTATTPQSPLYQRLLQSAFRLPPDPSQTAVNDYSVPRYPQPKQSTGGVGGLLKLFGLAKGGVVGGHHPYGHRGQPHAELVTAPQVRMLGQNGPTAVVPLTRRPGNHLNPEDIPNLMHRYGGR